MPSSELQPADELLPLVYEELRRLAAYKMAQEAPGQTLINLHYPPVTETTPSTHGRFD